MTGTHGPGRVAAFDLARGLAVVFMILVHVLWHWGSPSVVATPLGFAVSVLGGPPAAPVFMTLMGASIAFSTHADPRSLAKRGALLIVGGYALNIVRGVIPATLGLASGVVTAEQIAPFTPIWLLTSVDILLLAGCSLILIAGLRVLRVPTIAWTLLGFGLVFAAPAIRGLSTGSSLLDGILSPIWGDAPNVFYAVVPWAMYPLVGAAMGMWIAHSGDRLATIRRIGLVGVGLSAAGLVLIAVTRPGSDVATYWRHPPELVPAILGFVLAWVWICDVAARRLGDRAVLRILGRAGRRVTTIYVAHWVVVGWGIGLVGFQDLEFWPTIFAMVAVVAVTVVAATRVNLGRRVAIAGA